MFPHLQQVFVFAFDTMCKGNLTRSASMLCGTGPLSCWSVLRCLAFSSDVHFCFFCSCTWNMFDFCWLFSGFSFMLLDATLKPSGFCLALIWWLSDFKTSMCIGICGSLGLTSQRRRCYSWKGPSRDGNSARTIDFFYHFSKQDSELKPWLGFMTNQGMVSTWMSRLVACVTTTRTRKSVLEPIFPHKNHVSPYFLFLSLWFAQGFFEQTTQIVACSRTSLTLSGMWMSAGMPWSWHLGTNG